MFYTILIYPLELIIEFAYYLFDIFLKQPGLAIIGVSIAVTLLSLPLYIIAEKWQQVERDTQKKLKPNVDRIKAVFKGDEQYMILNTYYKQNNYHPIYALRSSISLIIQVPFFIAAYHFLSNLEILQGQSFFFIKNLGSPDALLHIGRFSINILPILMTLINIIAGMIYTKGFPIKEKLQLYGMALIFLFLLYNSPSGLVLYWTMNNVLSLIKNIFYKIKNPIKVLYFCFVAIFIGVLGFVLLSHFSKFKKIVITAICCLVFVLPLILKFVKYLTNTHLTILIQNKKLRNSLFIFSSIGLVLLSGILIPTNLISTSVQEFSFIDNISNPLTFVKNCFLQSFGLFFIWCGAFYLLFNDKIKSIITYLFCSLLLISTINTFVLVGNYGNINSSLVFDTGINKMFTVKDLSKDFFTIFGSFFLVIILLKFKPTKILNPIIQVFTLCFVILSCINMTSINSEFKKYEEKKLATENNNSIINLSKEVHLSKTEPNVIVFMLDRAISAFIPQIFEEKPELQNKFSGFTYYPNTLSVNGHTILGAPPLFGGYDYLPENVNKRSDTPLVEKHNEALKLMPTIFSQNGYNVTVTDPSWANYSWIPDNSIFDKMENVYATNLSRKYTKIYAQENNIIIQPQSKILNRNLFLFSAFRMLPISLRGMIYEDGTYCAVTVKPNPIETTLDTYSVLEYLPEITSTESVKPTFSMITNDFTHDSVYLEYPEYKPVENPENVGKNSFQTQYEHKTYHVNMAALLKLGEFFDYLKQENVYDNTKIIIASDHGEDGFSTFDDFDDDLCFIASNVRALLMVKDFNSNSEIITDTSFMCNADVPYLVFNNLIENPINPYTNNEIKKYDKSKGIKTYPISTTSPDHHNKNTFNLGDSYYVVKDDIFDESNWSKQ